LFIVPCASILGLQYDRLNNTWEFNTRSLGAGNTAVFTQSGGVLTAISFMATVRQTAECLLKLSHLPADQFKGLPERVRDSAVRNLGLLLPEGDPLAESWIKGVFAPTKSPLTFWLTY